MDIDDFTRVFRPRDPGVAHLLHPWDTANSVVNSMCGVDPEPMNWMGTGSQEEWEDAATRPTCAGCHAEMERILANQAGTAPGGSVG